MVAIGAERFPVKLERAELPARPASEFSRVGHGLIFAHATGAKICRYNEGSSARHGRGARATFAHMAGSLGRRHHENPHLTAALVHPAGALLTAGVVAGRDLAGALASLDSLPHRGGRDERHHRPGEKHPVPPGAAVGWREVRPRLLISPNCGLRAY